MYLGNKVMEICKVENGYLIEMKVPLKNKGNKDNASILQDLERHLFKETPKQLAKSIKLLLPLLDEDYKSDQDFDTAFAKASKKAEADE